MTQVREVRDRAAVGTRYAAKVLQILRYISQHQLIVLRTDLTQLSWSCSCMNMNPPIHHLSFCPLPHHSDLELRRISQMTRRICRGTHIEISRFIVLGFRKVVL